MAQTLEPCAMPNNELLSASNAEIDDAMHYASPMVLRGLLYQLTGDADVMAMPPGPSAKFGVGKEMANDADADLLKAKGGVFDQPNCGGFSH